MMNILTSKKNLLITLSVIVIWLMIWGTYSADIFRVFASDFPEDLLDLIHGIRSFLPFVAIILAIIFLLNKYIKGARIPDNFFLTPLGLLSIYTIIGIISSVFSNHPIEALYWGILYGSLILVLVAVLVSSNSAQNLFTIISVNWVIYGFLSIALIIYFFIQPGVIDSLTYNFLFCSDRPFENLADIPREILTFGIAGTRPTGLARYAGVMAITALAYLLWRKKDKKYSFVLWFFSFIVFFLILFFAKGRTANIGFIIATIFIIYFGKKIKWSVILGILVTILLLLSTILFNIPCAKPNDTVSQTTIFPVSTPSESTNTVIDTTNPNGTVSQTTIFPVSTSSEPINTVIDTTNPISFNPISSFSTLTGRTTGVWPDSWQLFLTNPFWGYGFQADRFFLDGQHSHNILLQGLVQTGLFGTIPLMFAYYLTFIYLWRAFHNKNIEDNEKPFLMAITGIFIFFAVRSITESTGAYLDADWFFVAPIVAYAQYLNSKKPTYVLQENLVITLLKKKINIINLSYLFEKIDYWIKNDSKNSHWVIFCGMHGIVEGHKSPAFMEKINTADISLIDGMSLFFWSKLKGFSLKNRIAGPDFMEEYFRKTEGKGYSNFFLGDTEDTLNKLEKTIMKKFPVSIIAGTYSPPFTGASFTEEDSKKMIEIIKQKKPDVLWVSFSLRKQEEWIFQHRHDIGVPVVIGVGAAFKFLAGKVPRAPVFMQNMGLEWMWRLFHEPRRIWRRVFFDGPIFLWLVILELTGFKHYK